MSDISVFGDSVLKGLYTKIIFIKYLKIDFLIYVRIY